MQTIYCNVAAAILCYADVKLFQNLKPEKMLNEEIYSFLSASYYNPLPLPPFLLFCGISSSLYFFFFGNSQGRSHCSASSAETWHKWQGERKTQMVRTMYSAPAIQLAADVRAFLLSAHSRISSVQLAAVFLCARPRCNFRLT